MNRETTNVPLISIIIPVYNIEDYIEECIQSILNQTYKNLEIIIINDGSLDNSGNICDKNATIDSRIKVIHKTNGGLSDARNVGIRIAQGEYIAFVDGDDFISTKMISSLYHCALLSEADICACDFYRYESGTEVFVENENEDEIKIFTPAEALEQIDIVQVVAWNKLYKSQLFEDISYPLSKLHEDEFIIHRLLFKSNKVAYINTKLYYYRIRSESIMGNYLRKDMIEMAIEAFEDRVNFAYEVNWEEGKKISLNRFYNYVLQYYYLVKEKKLNNYLEYQEMLYSAYKRVFIGKYKDMSFLQRLLYFSPKTFYVVNIIKKGWFDYKQKVYIKIKKLLKSLLSKWR